ncbi:hypothetical protein LCGC14_2341470 [marine sediment metagenome]|uniref:HNH nuclease domain-containing protein n=1 Tax=marine sediment metagenome TaxID=412755 RepID=A0A0F9CBU5_9ZZZZ
MRKTEEQRFWAKVDKSGDCWEWTACRNKKGYGQFGISSPRRNILAHRWAYAQYVETDIRDLGVLVVRHRCDNPPCVNPSHLLPGTVRDNAIDASERGLLGESRGEKHGMSKLTDDKVQYARSVVVDGRGRKFVRGVTQKELSYLWGVKPSSLSQAVSGRTWKHI